MLKRNARGERTLARLPSLSFVIVAPRRGDKCSTRGNEMVNIVLPDRAIKIRTVDIRGVLSICLAVSGDYSGYGKRNKRGWCFFQEETKIARRERGNGKGNIVTVMTDKSKFSELGERSRLSRSRFGRRENETILGSEPSVCDPRILATS